MAIDLAFVHVLQKLFFKCNGCFVCKCLKKVISYWGAIQGKLKGIQPSQEILSTLAKWISCKLIHI